jgi:hypothetical protein
MNHANFAQTILSAAITDTTGVTIYVGSAALFPTVPFIIAIDTEAILVTTMVGTTWTVTRGYESSAAATHLNGAAIYHNFSAGEADGITVGLAQDLVARVAQDLNIIDLAINLETLKGAILTGVVANIFVETFLALTDITLRHGTYDAGNRKVCL